MSTPVSTLDVYTGVGTGPWHALGEQAIRESGVEHVFIQSAAFMSNASGWAESIRTNGVLASSTGEGRIAFIHPGDIADVIVSALLDHKARQGAQIITGPAALSYRGMVRIIGEATGRSIRYDVISDPDAMARTLAWATPEYAAALVDIWRAVREQRLDTVTNGGMKSGSARWQPEWRLPTCQARSRWIDR